MNGSSASSVGLIGVIKAKVLRAKNNKFGALVYTNGDRLTCIGAEPTFGDGVSWLMSSLSSSSLTGV